MHLRPAPLIALAFAALALAGCDLFRSTMEPLPVGQGGGPNALKKSPCVCIELQQSPIPQEWFAKGA
jgi:hypothetical protein